MTSRLERLFDLYAADLRRFAPNLDNHFGCPLCMQAIPKTGDLAEVVAEEHIVSEKLGGRLITLTCRRCNNVLGSELESHLVRRIHTDYGELPMAMRMEVGGTVQRGEIHFPLDPEEAIELRVVDKQTDPRETEKFKRLIPDRFDEVHLLINGGYVEARSVAALVRSAYLLMFRTFGYRYVLDPSAESFRKQIAEPLNKSDVLSGVRWYLDAPIPPGTSLWIVREPAEFKCLLAVLNLNEAPRHLAAVTIPPPGEGSGQFFTALAASSPKQISIRSQLPLNAKGFLPLQELWAMVEADEL